MNRNSIGMLLLVFAALLLPMTGFAYAEDTVYLREMRAQVPDTVTFTIDGQSYEALVVLPEAEMMPILTAECPWHDTEKLLAVIPDANQGLHKSHMDYALGVWRSRYFEGTNYASAYTENGLPENNDLPPEWPLAFAKEILAAAGLDEVDLRIYRQLATTGYYRPAPYKSKFARSVGFTEPDFSKPIKGWEKGMYEVQFQLYFGGIPLFGDTYMDEQGQHAFERLVKGENWVMAPLVQLGARVRSEDDCDFFLFNLLAQTGVLAEDTALAPFEAVVRSVQARIDAGKLKSIDRLVLGYTPNYLLDDDKRLVRNAGGQECFVLTPCWRVEGYDTHDSVKRIEYQGAAPTYEERNNGPKVYELRLDAGTAEVLKGILYEK